MAPGGAAFPTPRVADPVYVNAAGATTVSTCGWPSDIRMTRYYEDRIIFQTVWKNHRKITVKMAIF
jgi:hypothetical protein